MKLSRLGRAALSTAWLVLLPLLTTVALLGFALPPSRAAFDSGPLAWLNGHLALAFCGLFLLCSLLARYWLPVRLASASASAPKSPARVLSVLLFVVAGCVVVAVMLRASVVHLARVDSSSMLPTLAPGDVILVNQTSYGWALPHEVVLAARPIQRGEVVVLRRQRDGRAEDLVKRVVALPGDVVDVRGGHAIINGWEAPSCDAGRYVYRAETGWISGKLFVEFLGDAAYLTVHTPRVPRMQAPYHVQPGELFVLGDNRNSSNDSRVWNDGRGAGLPISSVMGRVALRLSRQKRDGSLDLHRLLAKLDTAIDLAGMDVSDLEAGVSRCLAVPPSRTLPPAAP